MGRTALALLLLAFAVAGLALTATAQQDLPPEETSRPRPAPESIMSSCQPDRLLVKVQPMVDATALVARYGGTITRTIAGIDVHVVSVPGGQGQQILDAMNADPEVQYAEADQIVRAAAQGSGC